MALHPGMTLNLWLRDLRATYPGDSITLGDAVVSFTITNRRGDAVMDATGAVFVEAAEGFRLICPAPSEPGWYEAIVEVEVAGSTFMTTSQFIVEAMAGAGS